jgi:hypothetical protein
MRCQIFTTVFGNRDRQAEEVTMQVKKIVATAAAAGALGFAVFAGAAPASADPWNPFIPFPGPSPGQISQLPFVPPPGQIGQLPFIPPPGHWNKWWKWF